MIFPALKAVYLFTIYRYTHPDVLYFATLRILGVLAYFSVSGLVNSLILLYTPVYHFKLGFLSRWNARVNYKNDPLVHAP